MLDLTHLQGRTALVTGASSGIGRAVALALGRQGVRVAICARREDRLRELAAEIEAEGGEALVIPADLRDLDAIAALFAQIRETWGGVDLLINNAGFGKKEPLISGDPAAWKAMLEVNVLALAVCTQEALADMRRRDVAGHVVHISSMSGHRIPEGSGMYSASKFAVRSLTEGLRKELRAADSEIRVTSISPGFVETEFAKVYNDGDEEAVAKTYDDYPVLQAGDIADAVLFAVGAPAHVQYHDLLVRPTKQRN